MKCANALISSNSHTFGKKLFSSADFGPKVNVFVTKDDERQAELLSGEILGSTYMHHARWKDYAVLYRSSHLSRVIEKAFVKALRKPRPTWMQERWKPMLTVNTWSQPTMPSVRTR